MDCYSPSRIERPKICQTYVKNLWVGRSIFHSEVQSSFYQKEIYPNPTEGHSTVKIIPCWFSLPHTNLVEILYLL